LRRCARIIHQISEYPSIATLRVQCLVPCDEHAPSPTVPPVRPLLNLKSALPLFLQHHNNQPPPPWRSPAQQPGSWPLAPCTSACTPGRPARRRVEACCAYYSASARSLCSRVYGYAAPNFSQFPYFSSRFPWFPSPFSGYACILCSTKYSGFTWQARLRMAGMAS